MEIKAGIVQKSRYRTTEWAGGTTTELLIYPPGSSYSKRNFKWRISSAAVAVPESVFTSLPGIARHIMVTEGSLVLEHEGRYSKVLEPFQQDFFMGDWKTVSLGRATDFNLMLSKGLTGSLEVHFLEPGEHLSLSIDKREGKKATVILYALKGTLKFELGSQEFNVGEKDSFYAEHFPAEGKSLLKVTNTSGHQAAVIRAEIVEEE